MAPERRRPGRLVLWWEARPVWQQIVIAFPPLAVLLFAINLVPFGLPALRSAGYGVFEGGIATGLLLVATATEKSRRQGGD